MSKRDTDAEIQAKYPLTEKKPVTEQLHEVNISDPYRWLEDIDDKNVKKWIDSQNSLTREVLDRLPNRESIKKRLEHLQARDEVLQVKESKTGLFFLKKLATKEQPVLFFQSWDQPDEQQIILDTTQIDSQGITSIDYFYPSYDGSMLIYGISEGGSEWSVLHVLNMLTREIIEEKIDRAKWSTVQWKKDNSGFFYTRFPKLGEVPSGQEIFNSHVRFHLLGTNPDADPIIFSNPEKPTEYPFPSLSPDESFLIIMSHRFTSSDLYFIDLTTESPDVSPIIVNSQWQLYPFIGKNFIYFVSNHESSKFGLYQATKNQLSMDAWVTIIEPQKDVLQDILLASDNIAVLWIHDVKSRISLHNFNGNFIAEIPIPEMGAVEPSLMGFGMTGGVNFDHVYFNYMSFLQAKTTFVYHIPSNKLDVFFSPDLELDTNQFTVKEGWYPSKDGTEVHMFIIHANNLSFDKPKRTILYGYGGFGISYTPFFYPNFISWIEQGGVVAVANIRGGGEHGEEWHQAGILDKKQNVFDDFIAGGKYLIQAGYSSSATLGIFGGSNGGLLVGAATVQRPDLFSAVYCSVPLLDMLRYSHFSIGKTWIPEYGDPNDPDHFKWLFAYSPYHNVKGDANYPAILFKTATNDNRVDPIHALKMTALLQSNSATNNPILLWVQSEAGHGLGQSVTKLIEEGMDMLSFFQWRLSKS